LRSGKPLRQQNGLERIKNMNQCDNIRSQMTFYLDNELKGSEVDSVESHLDECAACRDVFDDERRFLESLRECSPLRVAPPELSNRVETILQEGPSVHAAPAELRRRIQRLLAQLGSSTSALIAPRYVPTAIAIVVVVLLAGLWYAARKSKSDSNHLSDFAMMAINNHQRHLRGQLPLETASDEPDGISNWFSGKVSFGVKLPNYQESSGQEKLYELEGARLVGYKNDYAAFVAYRMHKRPISLLMTSNAVAQPSGGEEVISNGITFHCDAIDGLKVISWSDRGLTYALVSDLEERGQQSCIICHQGTKDQDFIQELKPR
jgi:anti-sigma factor RsiW